MSVRSEINVTPFIDVLLVLFVIFLVLFPPRMVLVSQLAQERGSTSEDAPLMLELTEDGRYLLNHTEVAADSLAATLRYVFELRPSKVLFVKADRSRTYKEAIRMMDVARGAGVEVLSLVN